MTNAALEKVIPICLKVVESLKFSIISITRCSALLINSPLSWTLWKDEKWRIFCELHAYESEHDCAIEERKRMSHTIYFLTMPSEFVWFFEAAWATYNNNNYISTNTLIERLWFRSYIKRFRILTIIFNIYLPAHRNCLRLILRETFSTAKSLLSSISMHKVDLGEARKT